jgi:glutamine synthetase
VSEQQQLVALVCCDLGAIVRGRSLFASELPAALSAGVGWLPANHALTPLGPLADCSPFDSTGDLRLLPDPDTRVRVDAGPGAGALELLLCDIVETDGRPWECCPRQFLREALSALEAELGGRLVASFEHEFQLLQDSSAALPFSLEAQRRGEPFATRAMSALVQAGVEPERIFPEYAPHQFEIPVAAIEGMRAADRAVVLREVVREIARREGMRASFSPLLDPREAGNGVHIHLSVLGEDDSSLFHDASRPACLSQIGERFAAGILAHVGALNALTAPSPVSAVRLRPHRWSAGAACVGERNRETLLRIPPLVELADGDPARQLRLEYRGADASANPYLALGALLRAGLDGVRCQLAAPPILDRDPTELEGAEAERFGVGALPTSLEDAMRALAEDATARAWMGPLLHDAYASVKQSEIVAARDAEVEELCARYGAIY